MGLARAARRRGAGPRRMMGRAAGTSTLHVLYSLRAEGCPRLALQLVREELREGREEGRPAVAALSGEDWSLAPELEALQVPVREVGWWRRDFLGLARRSCALVRELAPRRILCYTVGMHLSVGVGARQSGAGLTLHLGSAAPSSRRAAAKIKLQIRAGDPFVETYVACSEHVRRCVLRDYGLAPSSVVAIPNAVDLGAFRDLRRIPRELALRVGMVASVEPSKDYPTLLRAIAHLVRERHAVTLRVVGGGSAMEEMRALARELGIADVVLWRGVQRDVAAELAQIDVFAFSVLDVEGLGIALVEALAAGIPVVATDVGACREVLEEGRHGILVPRGSAEGLAARILEAARRGAVAGADVVAKYGSAEVWRRYRDAMDGVPPEAATATPGPRASVGSIP